MATAGTESANPYPTLRKLSRDQCSIQSGNPAETERTKDDLCDVLLSPLLDEEERNTVVTLLIGVRCCCCRRVVCNTEC